MHRGMQPAVSPTVEPVVHPWTLTVACHNGDVHGRIGAGIADWQAQRCSHRHAAQWCLLSCLLSSQKRCRCRQHLRCETGDGAWGAVGDGHNGGHGWRGCHGCGDRRGQGHGRWGGNGGRGRVHQQRRVRRRGCDRGRGGRVHGPRTWTHGVGWAGGRVSGVDGNTVALSGTTARNQQSTRAPVHISMQGSTYPTALGTRA